MLRPGVLSSGVVNPGVVSPGVVNPGVVSSGVVRPGVVRPGVVRPGVVRPGVVSSGVVSPGVVSPGAVRPGVVRPGEVRPGEVRPGEAKPGEVSVGLAADAPDSRPVGIGGMLTPNCESPCDSAENSSIGRSVIIAACTNSRCCGSFASDISDTAAMATGLATARAATALMAVESLRRRRFGTEVSSIHGLRVFFGCCSGDTVGVATVLVPR